MKVIICGGGTGGHIYPAISIVDALKRRYENINVLYIGTASGLESTLIPKYGLEFKAIRVKGFRRRLSFDTLKSAAELFKGLYDAEKLLRIHKPDIVIGTGGYVAGPVLAVAQLRGIPTLIHEQNVMPGLTNRLLGRFADGIAISFEEAAKYFPKKGRIFVTGNPIRQEIAECERPMALKEFRFTDKTPIVLSFGGSKGSTSLNRAMVFFVDWLNKYNDFQLLHVTGEDHYGAFVQALKKKGIILKPEGPIRVVPYLHCMPRALALADLVITSAGAVTIAELTAVGLPSILIPKSYVAGNHQEYNAKALEKRGAAIMIAENRLKGEHLYKNVSNLITDKERLYAMGRVSKNMGKTDAADRICDIVANMIKG